MENITQHKEYEKEILLAKSKAEESDKNDRSEYADREQGYPDQRRN